MAEYDLRGIDRIALHLEGDRGGRQRPIKSVLFPDFVCGILHARSGDQDLCQDFVRAPARSPASLSLAGLTKNLSRPTSRLPGRRRQLHLGAERDQSRSEAGCANEVSRTTAEDRVVPVVAGRDQALAVFHRKQTVTGAEIPASRPLAQIAADRSHIPDLRAR